MPPADDDYETYDDRSAGAGDDYQEEQSQYGGGQGQGGRGQSQSLASRDRPRFGQRIGGVQQQRQNTDFGNNNQNLDGYKSDNNQNVE